MGQFITNNLTGATSANEPLPPGTTITAVGPSSLTLSQNSTEDLTPALIAWSDCTEPAKACTIPISESLPKGKQANFTLASADGKKALFTLGPRSDRDLYEFDVETGTSALVAHKVWGTVGASHDASRVYFVSEENLAAGATEGKANLYLDQEGTITFIATLARRDAREGTEAEGFDDHTTTIVKKGRTLGNRVSFDGRYLVFMSSSNELAELVAGYDNTDAVSGKEDREVYLYEVDGGLRCVSCNPSGARPTGAPLDESFRMTGKSHIWAAAWIPGWERELLAQRVLASDGSRVFFNSYDALAPGDTNGVQDVYQWERPGTGDCNATSSSFSAQNGGCVNLISSGQSPQVSEFVDATPSGDDVFFTTGSSLASQDPGLIDIYNARVNGGFPEPYSSVACEGEACQTPPAAPNDPTPASAAYNGPGNVSQPAQKKKHKKHKQKKKHKKSKKKGGKAKRHAANNSTQRNG